MIIERKMPTLLSSQGFLSMKRILYLHEEEN